ncbi:glutathione S-transferase family protein [Loktanella sp. Alg231-35]|uniref:glutathione S-transferase family protein n=1 Tax=Loktanella sp. Alg231-35 TaxID=1922220 RepID=UPI000D55367F|nr:glutathione S-transferase family protein [Loktanella sp. Alg231-35]
MTAPLRLHYAPDNASLCVRLALAELDLPYDTVLVDRAMRAQKSANFLLLNPNGLIPVLETQHGPMFETAAIILWLAEQQGDLMPAPGTPERQYALQWMMWLANTLHPNLRMIFYPDQYIDGDTAALRQKAGARLIAHLDVLSASETTPWLDDEAASAQACYLGPMLRWAALYGGGTTWFDLQQWPRLHAFARRAEQRPATLNVAAAEGLGPTPFSAPSPCDPPEGSAL